MQSPFPIWQLDPVWDIGKFQLKFSCMSLTTLVFNNTTMGADARAPQVSFPFIFFIYSTNYLNTFRFFSHTLAPKECKHSNSNNHVDAGDKEMEDAAKNRDNPGQPQQRMGMTKG
jgi:hypothetical protein